MDQTALLVTLVLEVLLVLTRFVAKKMREDSEDEARAKALGLWKLMPFSFKLDWHQCPGNRIEKGKPPKMRAPRSRNV